MKELIKFEFQKIIQQRNIYIIGVLMFALFLFVFVPPSENREAHYAPYEGEITAETAADLKDLQGTEAANHVYQSFLNERGIAESVQEKIQELAVAADNDPAAALEREMLQQLTLDTFYYHDAPGQTIDFVNTFGLVIAGALILLGLFTIFSNEYATGVDHYIFTSKRGRKQIVHAKLFASFLYTFLVVCVLVLFNVSYHFIRLGGSGWQSPLQFIWKYNHSPYDFTLAEYFGVQAGVHLIGSLAFATLVLLVSALCSKPITSFLISGIIFGLPIVWTSILGMDPNWLIDISFTNIMKVEELFLNFSAYDVGGLLILKPVFLVVLCLIFSFVLIYTTYYYIRHREV